ncbi:YqiA/YcfP family alpha/beta fold hydrolase [Flavobacterium caseinilyticum]|uniref:Alpha/beta hydrolase n=1 Tax=Flavobacterium caseinilyticum TaxID=2541732 RepID=A0A4R5AP72_9FLAO|nr:YqiA/YcfP family alpha/beta fold hydrolase [Flavobacterium caseinilyticum]TDD74621.1 alpha/beta hydrolase [Flavobacterium caseinilyticum]
MNILFLHGLESKLSPAKRVILETYGIVIAPDLDYNSNPNTIQNLYDEFKSQEITVIIGSSMGGFAAYHLANSMGICALLYNPALPYRNNVVQNIPSDLPKKRSPLMRIVLGGQDDVIKAKDNLVFLSQNFSELKECTIQIINELAHQIPVPIFEKQAEYFFEELCY